MVVLFKNYPPNHAPILMPTSSKSTTITKRKADSFKRFSDPSFKTGYQQLATLQPLNKSKRMGWFLKEQDLPHCEWTASEDDMAYPEHPKGAVIFNYEQSFGGYGAKKNVEKGINFTSIRFQILHVSPLIIQQTMDSKLMIGTFEMPHAKALFDADKAKAADDPNHKREYTVRTMYCGFVLTKDNRRAHAKPVVLSIKGLNGVDLSGKKREFDRSIEACLNKVNEEDVSATFGEKIHALTVFSCSFERAMEGERGVEICGIESYETPIAETVDEAAEALDRFMVPEDDYENTWTDQERYKGYIQSYCDMISSRLGGQYGIAPGVEILPATSEAAALPAANENPTGEDVSL